MKNIPGYDTFADVSFLDKGWSEDKKYRIRTQEGRQLLLRLSDSGLYERRQSEFHALKMIAALGVQTSEPLSFGWCEDGRSVYRLLTWVEGEDGESALPKLPAHSQYELGRKAGAVLQSIHTIAAPADIEPWEKRFRRKTEAKIERYRACAVHFEGDEIIIGYLQANHRLLDNRPQCLQHGDYHVGNLIITGEGQVGVIDFNRIDYGDPWEEFNRVVWCAAISPAFAAGRIDGYFNDAVPPQFFPLLAYYIASNALSSIYWAIPFGQTQVDIMLQQASDVLHWFDAMSNPVPTWYRQGEHH